MAKRAGVIILIVIVILAGVFSLSDIGYSAKFYQAILVALSNTIFISVILFVIAFFAARAYLNTGMHQILWLGTGSLAFGLGSLLSASQIGFNLNLSLIIYNVGALLAGIFYLHGIFHWPDNTIVSVENFRHKLNVLLIYYPTVWIVMILFYLMTYFGSTSLFLNANSSPTVFNYAVMGVAATLIVISFVVYIVTYLRVRIDFFFWYALALLLIGIGLLLINLGPAGTPVAWLGRIASWIGGLYFLPAIYSTVKQAREKGVGIADVVAGFFRDPKANYELLVEESSDAILSTDKTGRIILWNSAAEKIFGYSRNEAIGMSLWGYVDPQLSQLCKRGVQQTDRNRCPQYLDRWTQGVGGPEKERGDFSRVHIVYCPANSGRLDHNYYCPRHYRTETSSNRFTPGQCRAGK